MNNSIKRDEHMSEVEDLRIQLAEAQEENKALRAIIGRKKRQEAFPDTILKKFPLVMETVGGKAGVNSYYKYYLLEWFTQKLSAIIRGTVFWDTAYPREGNGRRYIAVQNMDEEEYKLWLEMVEHVLADLEDGVASRREMLERRKNNGSEPETTAV